MIKEVLIFVGGLVTGAIAMAVLNEETYGLKQFSLGESDEN